MVHASGLGMKIIKVFRSRWHLDGRALLDGNSQPPQFADLLGVVCDQINGTDAKVADHQGRQCVIAFVGLMSKLQIGFDGIEALVLEIISTQFIEQADAASLLAEIKHHTASGLRNHLKGAVKLLSAVAAYGAEHVTGETLGMHTQQNIFLAANIAHHKCQLFLVVEIAGEQHELECAVSRRDAGSDLAVYRQFVHDSLPYEFGLYNTCFYIRVLQQSTA